MYLYKLVIVFSFIKISITIEKQKNIFAIDEPDDYLFRNETSSFKSALFKEFENNNFFRNSIVFKVYKHGKLRYETQLNEGDNYFDFDCNVEDKHAFILHGWKQNCQASWVEKLVDRLTFYRGGCVVCIDYEKISDISYIWLVKNFEGIAKAFLEKFRRLISQGLNPETAYIFGFSYGAQIASYVGRVIQPKFHNMDLCDIAGPLFDFSPYDHTLSAKHVQCLHSSHDKGTNFYECHQNVRLGYCGYSQDAALTQEQFTSHGLCVQIYINAFDYPFYALQSNFNYCITKKPASEIPADFTIGYNEHPNKNVLGDIFVPTSPHYPYNLSKRELRALEKKYNATIDIIT